ncbi:hypothetical protein [Mixta calida]|nr:hypothetical protein [Mixta calida]MDU3817381.1 hypothetical protein [Pantoea sp.]MDU5193106.1 hypothetical protein [Mixta calida]MDU5768425.1 hypothetical protein [Mixta calida]MDU5829147.1 hypothetical protein [Mixta calida]MDU6537070.1 hypothetical protein [Mixta calida]
MKSINPASSRLTGGHSAVAELAEQQRLRLLFRLLRIGAVRKYV